MRRTRWPAAVGLAGATAIVAGASGASRAVGPADAQTAAPAVTLLYQNFPNPFPSGSGTTTCIWFDLAVDGAATLDVHDLRGNRVRRIFPAAGESGTLAAGRYGRGAGGAGCDGRFSWDGTDQDGRRVPSGVYLLRLGARDAASIRKMVFRGG